MIEYDILYVDKEGDKQDFVISADSPAKAMSQSQDAGIDWLLTGPNSIPRWSNQVIADFTDGDYRVYRMHR